MSRTSVIVDAVRSPMGVKKGNLIGIRADDLAAQVVMALLERQPDLPREAIEDVVLGCAFPENTQGMLMARGVALLAGIPKEAGGKVVNRFCGSSMDAVHQLSQAILVGDRDDRDGECARRAGVAYLIKTDKPVADGHQFQDYEDLVRSLHSVPAEDAALQ